MAPYTRNDAENWAFRAEIERGIELVTNECVHRRAVALLALPIVCVLTYVRVVPYSRAELDPRTVQSTRLLDREGRLLYHIRSESGGYSQWVPLARISPDVIRVTLSGEDAGFYAHPGIDPVGVARAIWLDLLRGKLVYGGSTITQQLAKRLGNRRRNAKDKLIGAVDALRLERTLDKDEILTQYLNRIYYGRQAYGIEAASQRFFGKHASELRLDEAALLAILPRGPSAYDPDRHPEAAKRRRTHVLRHMVERGWLSANEARVAERAPIRLVTPRNTPSAPHLVDYLKTRNLIAPGEREVHTTVDLVLQQRIERRVKFHLRSIADDGVDQAAVVVLDNATGDVLAMVGSRAYGDDAAQGAVNGATAQRHPGSALKPFLYAIAMEHGEDPSSPVLDAPRTWNGYRPRNASSRHFGVVSMRQALGSSLNVPAVELADRYGTDVFAQRLRAAGVHSIDSRRGKHGLALSLGAARVSLLDLASAYATLANGGEARQPRLLTSTPPSVPVRVFSERAASRVTDMLTDPAARRLAFGFETPLDLPFPVAAKTGTSQSFCDNVAVGYTREVTVGVWAGNFDGRPMRGVLAMRGAAPLFREVMLAAMEGRR